MNDIPRNINELCEECMFGDYAPGTALIILGICLGLIGLGI